jgi:hypothetical protein
MYFVWSIAALLGAAVATRVSYYFWERTMLLWSQLLRFVTFAALAVLLGGCTSLFPTPDTGGDASASSGGAAAGCPLWLLLMVGAVSSVAGSLQQPGLQGLYANLVGKRGQGLFQVRHPALRTRLAAMQPELAQPTACATQPGGGARLTQDRAYIHGRRSSSC